MAENGAVQNELTLRQIVDGISALVAVLTPDGAVETVNGRVLDYFDPRNTSRCTAGRVSFRFQHPY